LRYIHLKADIKNRKFFTLFALLNQYRIELATWNIYNKHT
jgi:hypothetical protein